MGFLLRQYKGNVKHLIMYYVVLFRSDNIVSLDIYFEDLSYDIIEQTPLYEIWALIG